MSIMYYINESLVSKAFFACIKLIVLKLKNIMKLLLFYIYFYGIGVKIFKLK